MSVADEISNFLLTGAHHSTVEGKRAISEIIERHSIKPLAKDLIAVVNNNRYRGIDGDGPMRETFSWPMKNEVMEEISLAALGFVLDAEKRKT